MSAPEIGVGLLGYAFMGKAHVNALRTLAYMTWPPPLLPRLVAIAGRDERAVGEAAQRFGFERATTRWEELVEDPAIGLLDDVGPNAVHAAPTIAAARAGKHVLCEKPLGRDADESLAMWRAVAATGVQHMCAFNYRFVPAVRLAREMLEAGELGEIFHFRARYLQDWLVGAQGPAPWRLRRDEAGSGVLGDLGTHIVDLARYLVGEPTEVTGLLRTFVGERDGAPVDVDDAFEATLRFGSGAVGTLEASRFCPGRKNALTFEVNGERGSLAFDLERLNELQVHRVAGADGRAEGFQTVLVTAPEHPFLEHWWPEGHTLGWEHTFVHELRHLLAAIAGEGEVAPQGATFEDGYRAAEVCDAIVRSAQRGAREEVAYRGLEEPATAASSAG